MAGQIDSRSLIRTMAFMLAIFLIGVMGGCASYGNSDHIRTQPGTVEYLGSVNMFGGPMYSGQPALAVTAALIESGGGVNDFSFAKALVFMLGEEAVSNEVAKLTQQYGQGEVETFIAGMDLAISLSLKHAMEAGIELPEPAQFDGVELARALVIAGTSPDGTFWSGYLFDKAVSNVIHHQVMEDINSTVGYEADLITHKILNQAMYDVAQALGLNETKLASLH